MSFDTLPAIVYVLCLLASVVCVVLLARTWRRTRSRLLLWTALGFALIAANNLLLVLDMLVLTRVDLWPYRALTLQAGLLLLLVGFIWETD